jgi:hypothetical protein
MSFLILAFVPPETTTMLNNMLSMQSLKTILFILEVSIHTSLEKVQMRLIQNMRFVISRKGMAAILFLELENGNSNFNEWLDRCIDA